MARRPNTDESRVRDALGPESPPSPVQSERLRAHPRHGGDPWQIPLSRGKRAPSEWSQGRQSPGKPRVVDPSAADRYPGVGSGRVGEGDPRSLRGYLLTPPTALQLTYTCAATLLEVRGFEPLCSGDHLGLLRAQPAYGSHLGVSTGGRPLGQPGCDVPRWPPGGTLAVSLLSDARTPTAGTRGGRLPRD